ncbi:MAG: GNAT family N-acetyltransferase [Planctomycetota bacterium]
MGLTYHKRYRMELDLRRAPPWQQLPVGYRLVAWSARRLADHAAVKHASFREEIDAQIFPCLAEHGGCRQLMEEISRKPGFLPEATWLIEYTGVAYKPEFCGTVQGVRVTPRYGGIQNVGVTAEHRGRGLGKALVAAAVQGFSQAGLRRAYLEVTAENAAAVELYRRLGFRRVKTLYKSVEVAYATPGR